MSAPVIAIVYEGQNRLLSLATVNGDHALLIKVAIAALQEAAEKARLETDPGLAEIQKQNAVRLAHPAMVYPRTGLDRLPGNWRDVGGAHERWPEGLMHPDRCQRAVNGTQHRIRNKHPPGPSMYRRLGPSLLHRGHNLVHEITHPS